MRNMSGEQAQSTIDEIWNLFSLIGVPAFVSSVITVIRGRGIMQDLLLKAYNLRKLTENNTTSKSQALDGPL